jgi:TPR repeat protein
MLSLRQQKIQLLIAAETGDAFAQFQLGKLYKEGDKQTPPNHIAAKRWLTMAYQNGYQEAINDLENIAVFELPHHKGKERLNRSFSNICPQNNIEIVKMENHTSISHHLIPIDHIPEIETVLPIDTREYRELLNYIPDDLVRSLQAIIGMPQVKRQLIKRIIQFGKTMQAFPKGMQTNITKDNLHCLLIGDTGSGKTAIATVISQVLSYANVLKNDQILMLDLSLLANKTRQDIQHLIHYYATQASHATLLLTGFAAIKEYPRSYHYVSESISEILCQNPYENMIFCCATQQDIDQLFEINIQLPQYFKQRFTFHNRTEKELYEYYLQLLTADSLTATIDALPHIEEQIYDDYQALGAKMVNEHYIEKMFKQHKKCLNQRQNESERLHGSARTNAIELCDVA